MTLRSIAWITLTVAGSTLSAGVSLYAFYSAINLDWHQDTLLTAAYCLLPMLCFPVFFLVRPARRAALVLGLLICGFWAAYSALSRRTCAELGYCGSVVSTMVLTLKALPTLAFLAVAAISLMRSAFGDRVSSRGAARGTATR